MNMYSIMNRITRKEVCCYASANDAIKKLNSLNKLFSLYKIIVITVYNVY